MVVRIRSDELRSAGGFLRGLRPFLASPLRLPDARMRLERQLAMRESIFADTMERAVFANPASPYRKLLEWARITMGDVRMTLADRGLEGTLELLREAGVYLTLEEFKGWRPVERPGLELPVRAEDFDNPLLTRRFETRTGGSTAPARRIFVDLDLLDLESAYHALFFAAADASERPVAIWHLAPPGAVGLKTALIQAKLGRPAEKWFSQSRPGDGGKKHASFARATLLTANASGMRIPAPEYTPSQNALRVAQWLARHSANGQPGVLATLTSAGVRAATAALDTGLDISDSLLVLVGEPYTAAKASVVGQAQVRGTSHYAMTEAGTIGIACLAGATPDDVHLLSDKIATIQRDRQVPANGTTVQALFHTTLLPASPKLMLNVESGDYGVREDRDCGCGALPDGFRSHLHTIRSYEKLTSEGMHFLGADLLTLVEEVLPTRFGGKPTDYQLVESELCGLPKVRLVVRDSVGELDGTRVASTVLEFLRGRGGGQELMARVWAQGETLQVVRGDPHVTPGGKTPALHRVTG